ncbi:MAG: ribosome biogenesis GTP-binding protein YihA/YsxC [Blastocatellia bacterium]|jgi:GTP-binding protein
MMKETKAQFVLAATDPSSFPQDHRAEVAFLGRSNVGKSSLLNSLLGVRGLARTSSTPGRTQSINFFLIEQSFYFVDLPGYGYAKTSKEKRRAWGQLIERYLAERPQLVLSILLVDARHEPTLSDLQMKSWLQHHGLPFWVVCTKVDKLSANERRKAQQQAMATLGTDRVIPYSSITREGSSQVWEVIRSSVARSS